MMRIAGYLKLVSVLLFIGYLVGLVVMFNRMRGIEVMSEYLPRLLQLIFYVIVGPSLSVTAFGVSNLIEMREDDSHEYVTTHQLAMKQKRVFAEGEWTCTCGHENKSNYKVCIHCGKPRS